MTSTIVDDDDEDDADDGLYTISKANLRTSRVFRLIARPDA